MSYDSSVWYPVGASGSQNWHHNSTWGFTKGDQLGYVTFTERDTTCGTNHAFQAIFSNWTYVDSSGTPHSFGFSTRGPSVSPCIATTQTGTSVDGSGYTMSATADQINYVATPDGAVIHPTTVPGGGGSIQDRNGNLINGSGSPVTYTDTLGTIALSVAGTAPSNTTFTYTAPNGQPASYTMSYVTRTVKTNFGCSGIAEYGPTSNSLVDRITLPDGSFYQFNYEPTPGFSGDYTGRLASVTLPIGGTITYTYTGGSSGHITCADGSASGFTRQTPDGTWTYARTIGSGAASATLITAPKLSYDSAANQTIAQFQGIYETQRDAYQGAAPAFSSLPITESMLKTTNLLQETQTCYNTTAPPCTSTAITLPITSRTVLDQIGASGGICKHVYDYSSFGVLTEQDDYDYATGTPTTLLRKVIIATASLGNGIVDEPASITIQDGSGNMKAQTTFCYDEGTPSGGKTCAATGSPTATSGTPQHVAVSGSRGNPTTITQLVQGSTVLGRKITYFDTGTVNTSTDVNGAVTTFVYGTASCGNSFPTSVKEPLSMTRSFAWSCTGGVPTSVTDENGKVTSTTWSDPDFWRPAAIDFPDGGHTGFTYNSQTSTTVTQKMNSSQNIVSTVLLDTLGRTKQTQLNSDPQGVDYVDTAYDALGRVATVTNPHRSTSSTTDGTTTNAYDALSRPTSVTLQDGSVSSVSYSGNTVTSTDPAGKKRQSTYDSLGRLTQVVEDPGGLGYITTYTYDALGNLTGVVQNGSRNRTFVYDGLSRLLCESNPEIQIATCPNPDNGTYTAGTIRYAYDASGHAGDLTSRVAPLPNQTNSSTTVTTTYSYDLLHRLTQKSYSDGVTPTAHFVYDTPVTWDNPTATTTNVAGRLSEAYVDTCPANGGNEIFGYDVMGRVALNNQSTPVNCGTGNFALSYSYDLAGNMVTATDPIGGTITYAYDSAARPTTVTSAYVGTSYPATLATVDTAAGYYPAGEMRKMTLGNGLATTWALNARLQPCRYNTNSSGTALGTCADAIPSGNVQDFNLGFNAGTSDNGNVASFTASGTQNSSRSYSYDALNRLQAMSAPGDACSGLSWTYDAWGNRTAQNVTAGTCGASSVTVNTKNQLSGSPYTYDAAGNLTADGSHTYTYDAENRLTKVDGGNTASYLYDALGRRSRKTLPGTGTFDYVYDLNGNALGEWQVLTSPTYNWWGRSYIYLQGSLLASYRCSGTFFFHEDHLGSARLMTAMDKSVLDNLDYLPFGERITSTPICGTSHEFTGDERDSETSLDHTWFRQYSSQFARWTSPDPAGLAAVDPSNPQSWNRYSYVANDPMNWIDPWGMGPCGDFPSCVIDSSGPPDNGGILGRCFDILLDGVFVGNSCDGAGGHLTRLSGGGGVGGRKTTGNRQQTQNQGCAVQRIASGIKGILNIGVAAAKLGLAGASAASTPLTTVGGALGATYFGVGAAGNFTAGVVQIFGAFTGDITSTGQAATAATTVTTIGGYIGVVATGGNLEKASTWANLESVGTAAFNGGFTGHIIDQGATFLQKTLLSTDLGQSAADLLGLNTTGSCH